MDEMDKIDFKVLDSILIKNVSNQQNKVFDAVILLLLSCLKQNKVENQVVY